jgi:hypothetical protein
MPIETSDCTAIAILARPRRCQAHVTETDETDAGATRRHLETVESMTPRGARRPAVLPLRSFLVAKDVRLFEQVPPDAVCEAAPEGNRIDNSVRCDLGGIDVRSYLGGRPGSGDPPQAQAVVSMFLRVAVAERHGFLDRRRSVFAHLAAAMQRAYPWGVSLSRARRVPSRRCPRSCSRVQRRWFVPKTSSFAGRRRILEIEICHVNGKGDRIPRSRR